LLFCFHSSLALISLIRGHPWLLTSVHSWSGLLFWTTTRGRTSGPNPRTDFQDWTTGVRESGRMMLPCRLRVGPSQEVPQAAWYSVGG
jgi:hypothetical protein